MNRRHALHLALAIALLFTILSILAVAGPPTEQDPGPEIVHPKVWESLEAGGETEILVLLQAQADLSSAAALPDRETKGRYVYEALRAVAQESQSGLRAALDAQGAEYQAFYIVNAVQVRADSTLVRSLAARPEVGHILPNPRIKGVPDIPFQAFNSRVPQSVEANLTRVGADDVWALGYTGQGIVVAGQDTGYDWDHPALIDQYRGWDGATASHDYNWHDAIHSSGGICGADSPEPCDDHNHGTHTMGIIVGDDSAGNQVGMAPGAQWIGCRNMDGGVGTPATYIECFEFFLAPYPLGGDPLQDGEPSLAPHVVNNSWACIPSEGCSPEVLEATVEALRQAGIVVVVSAGNYGSGGCGSVQYPPAIYPQSFSVGNFDHRTGLIYPSSSRGPASYGGASYLKPNITAPGVRIRSSIRGGGYASYTGTSMAAPHVAGAVALLLSAAPGHGGQVDVIEHLLANAAEPRTTTEGCGGDGPSDVPNNTWGWGILDAFAAVRTATAGTLQGVVRETTSHAPLAGAEVTAELVPGQGGPLVLTGPTGQYTLTLTAGSYNVTGGANGYVPQTITNVLVISGEVKFQDFALEPLLFRYIFPLVANDS